jgi:uroporphyrinogen-III synthase
MKKILQEKKIIVTRSEHQSNEFCSKLSNLGAIIINLPLIEIKEIINEEIISTYKNISNYEWIIFTSTNSIEIFFKTFIENNFVLKELEKIKFAVVGNKTKNKLLDYGFKNNICPDKFTADFLLKEFINQNITNTQILIPTSSIAKKNLYEGLTKLGNKVNFLPIYENIKPNISISELDIVNADYITFTSPSTVENFHTIYNSKIVNSKIICIGTVTANKVKELFNITPLIPNEFTIDGMIDLIINNEKSTL